MGKLYIVATPIGNLRDIGHRALDILREVSAIACEDTRVSRVLLRHWGIDKPLIGIFQHTKREKIEKLVARLAAGEDLAYLTDAGTPGVSDPAGKLVAAAVAAGAEVSPIPGPSALTALLSVSGRDTQQFVFLGYPPHKKGRETFFRQVAQSVYPVVYYDSVHRVLKNLRLLAEKKPTAYVVLGRELTKMHEQILRGRPAELVEYFRQNPDKVKGEFVLAVF